jgi:hypothetical protein
MKQFLLSAIFAGLTINAFGFIPLTWKSITTSRLISKTCNKLAFPGEKQGSKFVPPRCRHTFARIKCSAVQQDAGKSISEETLRIAKLLRNRPFFDVGVVGGKICANAFGEKVCDLRTQIQKTYDKSEGALSYAATS